MKIHILLAAVTVVCSTCTANSQTETGRQTEPVAGATLIVIKRFNLRTPDGLQGFDVGHKVRLVRKELTEYVITDGTIEGRASPDNFSVESSGPDASHPSVPAAPSKNASISDKTQEIAKEQSEVSKSSLVPAEPVPANAPSFRGVYPGMTFQQLVQVTKSEPLGFQYEPETEDRANGIIVLEYDSKRVEDPAKRDQYYWVAVGDDGTKYEWDQIIVKMYKDVAVIVSFGIPARNASFLRSDTLPWASIMLQLLTKKYGESEIPVFNPSEYTVATAVSDQEQPVAKWTRGNYQINLSIGCSRPNYHAYVNYSYLPLLQKMLLDKSKVESNF